MADPSTLALCVRYVYSDTIAFSVGTELFYLKTGPDYPQIFDSNLNLQITSNVDIWIQTRTGQRYSYRGLCDMALAFRCGLETAYTKQDMRQMCESAIQAARDLLFQSERVSDYARTFWIELIDPARLEGHYATVLRDKFETLRENLGDDKFYNHLCRMWRLCNFRRPGEAAVFERLIRRLGRVPQEPQYPVTAKLDEELKRDALTKIWGRQLPHYKAIPDEIVERVHALHSGGLQRAKAVRTSS